MNNKFIIVDVKIEKSVDGKTHIVAEHLESKKRINIRISNHRNGDKIFIKHELETAYKEINKPILEGDVL